MNKPLAAAQGSDCSSATCWCVTAHSSELTRPAAFFPSVQLGYLSLDAAVRVRWLVCALPAVPGQGRVRRWC